MEQLSITADDHASIVKTDSSWFIVPKNASGLDVSWHTASNTTFKNS